ncbi:MAG TPA: 1-acyl-sn-glycerol-3-phosphate acyltransferase [Myxococcales bacterium]|nr:1-acyl-sn-glycerol-3-phosphate acyltransferase [Myxococcales bacterium]
MAESVVGPRQPEAQVPVQSTPTFGQRLARGLLRLFGWRVDIRWPPVPKAVVVVYPHTSNWDFLVGILGRAAAGLPLNWMAKDTLFRWPFGAFFRRLGGIPVNRRERKGAVAQLQADFARRPYLWLVIAPEGTRGYVPHWKSGFYRLACAAGVPLGLGYLDYGRRVVGIADWIPLSGDEERDLSRLRAFYADKRALKPAQAGAIRFRDEP